MKQLQYILQQKNIEFYDQENAINTRTYQDGKKSRFYYHPFQHH